LSIQVLQVLTISISKKFSFAMSVKQEKEDGTKLSISN